MPESKKKTPIQPKQKKDVARAALRNRRRAAQEDRERRNKKVRLNMGLSIGAILIVVVTLFGLKAQQKKIPASAPNEAQEIVLHLEDNIYVDPQGRFSIAIPFGWKVERYPGNEPYTVSMFGPSRCEISVLVNEVDYTQFPKLLNKIEAVEEQFGINAHIETIVFKGQPAVRRNMGLKEHHLLMTDFLVGNLSHHLVIEMPYEVREDMQKALEFVLDSYKILPAEEGADIEGGV